MELADIAMAVEGNDNGVKSQMMTSWMVVRLLKGPMWRERPQRMPTVMV
jgi:hypothetical protein